MLQESPKRIITNRQLNFTLSPVDTYNSKTMPHKLKDYEIDGVWNHHHSIILDVILDSAFRKFYERFDKLPQSWRSEKVIKSLDGFFNNSINDKSIAFLSLSPYEAYAKSIGYDLKIRYEAEYFDSVQSNPSDLSFESYVKNKLEFDWGFKDFIQNMQDVKRILYDDLIITRKISSLFESYPLLLKYKYNFIERLKQIEKTKLKFNYKVKYISEIPVYEDRKIIRKGNLKDVYYEMNDFQSIFKLDYDNEYIKINLHTPLGKIILYSVLILDTDWIPTDAFNLSKNAFFIYKRFVLNKVAGKFKARSLQLKFDEIKAFLDFSWSNDRGVHGIIINALNDIIEKDLVKSVNYDKKIGTQRIYELNFDDQKQDTPVEEAVEDEVQQI